MIVNDHQWSVAVLGGGQRGHGPGPRAVLVQKGPRTFNPTPQKKYKICKIFFKKLTSFVTPRVENNYLFNDKGTINNDSLVGIKVSNIGPASKPKIWHFLVGPL